MDPREILGAYGLPFIAALMAMALGFSIGRGEDARSIICLLIATLCSLGITLYWNYAGLLDREKERAFHYHRIKYLEEKAGLTVKKKMGEKYEDEKSN